MQSDTKSSLMAIGTTDRSTFRTCRLLWDYSSQNRLNYSNIGAIKNYEFGTAMHEAMEILYDPETWDKGMTIAKINRAKAAFVSYLTTFRINLISVGIDGDIFREIDDYIKIGPSIIDNYVEWASEADEHIRPVKTEIDFEVPIPVTEKQSKILRPGFSTEYNNVMDCHVLMYKGEVVLYKGIIDLLVYDDRFDSYIIIDHKTTSNFAYSSEAKLERDTQASAYYWALRMLDINVMGTEFNYILKDAPSPPNVLKSGKLSKAKDQKTTYNLYMQAIEDNDLDVADYIGFLEDFEEPQYFKRIESYRDAQQLKLIGEYILLEAMDMLGDPFIYPNINAFHQCKSCEFFVPCTKKINGEDDIAYIESTTMYIQNYD